MNKIFINCIIILLGALLHNSVKASQTDITKLLTELTPEQVFKQDSKLLTTEYFIQVTRRLKNEFAKESIEPLVVKSALNYLKAFAYFANKPNEKQVDTVDKLLSQLIAEKTLLKNNPDIQISYAATYHRWLNIEASLDWVANLAYLSKLMPIQIKQQDKAVSRQALWENFLAQISTLRWIIKNKEKANLDDHQDELQNYWQSLQQAETTNSQQHLWINQHLMWTAAKLRLLVKEEKDEQAIDLWARKISRSIKQLSLEQQNIFITEYYLSPIFATQDNCEEEDWANFCYTAKLEQVLPIEYHCSNSLTIRAEQLTKQQLEESCVKLTSQETTFHQLFDTNKEPVANDDNQSLRVVVFNDWSQYHRYAPMLFNIDTDNGGMYIEGIPSKPGNQATFFSFEAFWLRPDFKVWNLNHEYVHYLTGRFTTYGPFEHFPSHLVWWSEGIAEYIANAKVNKKAEKILQETSLDEIPSMQLIFDTEYNDGLERVYRWSYWAVRYLAENDQQQLRKLKQFLKTDYFEGYTELLTEIAKQHQVDFQQWIIDIKQVSQSSVEDAEELPRKINRYLYPDYMKPKWLDTSGWNQHF